MRFCPETVDIPFLYMLFFQKELSRKGTIMNTQNYLKHIDEVIAAGPYQDNWASLSGHPVPTWYQNAKFGIFIHWGVFSVPAYSYEWYPRHMYIPGRKEYEHHTAVYGPVDQFGYKDFIPMFKAEKFDADKWMELFARAGARYVMPVAEHHDGFQMYQSSLSPWNAVNMGPKKDILGQLRDAASRYNITFCASSHRAEHYWYFNGGTQIPSDVTDPAYSDFYGPAVYHSQLAAPFPQNTHRIDSVSPDVPFMEDWLARTCELVDRYHPSCIYFDWWIQNQAFKPYLKKFAAYYYNQAASRKQEVTIQYKYNAFAYTSAVYDIERGQMAEISPRPWQTDTAIAKNSWGYTENNDYKKAVDLIGDLIDIVSKNGCLLLNIGPRADGTIPEEETAVLEEIGAWLSVCGEGIYDTTFWKTFGEGSTIIPEGHFTDTARQPFSSEDIRYTYKAGAVYAFVMKLPASRRALLKSFALPGNLEDDLTISDVTLLGSRAKVFFYRTTQGMTLEFPEAEDTPYPICFRITID